MKAKTDTFILTLPLVVKPQQERTIVARLEAGRRMYNAVLHESLSRLSTMREDPAWSEARLIKSGPARSKAFSVLTKKYKFSKYALHDFVKVVRKSAGWDDRVGSAEAQKISDRAFDAVSKYLFGIRGRPRFKGFNRPLHSIEAKSNKAGIRFKPELGIVDWNGVTLPVKYPTKDTDDYVALNLAAPTKYCRILWRNIKGRKRWFVQMAKEGRPIKPNRTIGTDKVGLDLGPSTIAIVSDKEVGLEKFAPSVYQPWQEIRRIQRAMDRSQRASNPNNYHANGTIKKGRKTWAKSARYKKLQVKLAEIERCLAEGRKRDHGHLSNKILALGCNIKTEKLSYKSFQKMFGRSVKQRAPSAFMTQLRSKAERAGGSVEELDTWALKMSQYNHASDSYTKKPLSQRYHKVIDGVIVQRDIYSGFLALHAEGKEHNLCQLENSWTNAEALLRLRGLCVDEIASRKHYAFPTVNLPLERFLSQSAFGLGQDRIV